MMKVQPLWNYGQSRGFALPVAVFVMMVVSLLALNGLYVARNNATANTAARRGMKALYAADAGATRVLATLDTTTLGALNPGDSLDLGWRTLPDGSTYRTVVLRVDGGLVGTTPLYRLRTIGRPGAGTVAQREIVSFVMHAKDKVCCQATARGGASGGQARLKDGVTMSGRDTIPDAWGGVCPLPLSDKPGLEWKDGAMVVLDGDAVLEGDPPLVIDPTMDTTSLFNWGEYNPDLLAAMADITLPNEIFEISPEVSGGACDTSASTNWGAPEDPSHPCFDYFPVIHSPGPLVAKGDVVGQGILIVDGELTVEEGFEFYGVIIAKQEVQLKGGARIYGGLIVGGELQTEPGDYIRWSQCAVGRALNSLTLIGLLAGRHWFQVL